MLGLDQEAKQFNSLDAGYLQAFSLLITDMIAGL